jgi:hypothetical protein
MIPESIGKTAGDIWKYVGDNGPSTAIKIKSSLGISNTLLYLALGWLAREDKITIEDHEQGHKVYLKI